ncbi:MAG: NAD(P)/FAD-dependent oxidoreductase [Ignavibacteriaceae bacterium]
MKYNYDLIVIGGGAGGLTSSGLSASLGAKTALVEKSRLGGDCTWYGCVPSKALLKAAKVAYTFKSAEKYGIKSSNPEFDFSAIMKNIHKIQEEIYKEADAPEIYEKMGIDVIKAKAIFKDSHTIEVIDEKGLQRKITSKYFVIATGGSPVVPKIDGIKEIKYYTNENLFTLEKLPESIAIIGSGPIGTEMSQAFNRLGSKVTIIDIGERILQNDDEELAKLLQKILKAEGINYLFKNKVKKFEKINNKIKVVSENESRNETEVLCDAVLLSMGRKPNIDELNLDNIRVKTNKKGIIINKYCRTSVKNIFAVGDVGGTFQFTHYAEHMAKKAVSTALFHIPFSLEPENIVWSTYTEPEMAHAGLTEKQLKEKNIKYETYRFPFNKIDRAKTELETEGWIKIYAKSFNGKIYGADILGYNGGEMIGELSLAIKNGVTLRKFSDTIHPYPTYLLGNRRAADQWYVRKQSQTLIKFLQIIFGYRGKLLDKKNSEEIV